MTRLVLVGAGHAHAQVLLHWAQRGTPPADVVLVAPHALAPYSGMVPGWLAGRYRFDEIVIDFAALCRRAGVRWVQDELLALDPDRQTLQLAGGGPMSFDLLSLNVGSTLRPPPDSRARVLSMRPLADLRLAYEAMLSQWTSHQTVATEALAPFRVTAVGGGAAGFESVLAVLARLRSLQPNRTVMGRLVTRSEELLPGLAAGARRIAMRQLQQARVSLELSSTWQPDQDTDSHLVLWATGAQAHDWQIDPQRRGTLAVSAEGFVRIGPDLRSLSHPCILAVGDCAEWDPGPSLAKAGVYAVRMGPVLIHNLEAALRGGPLSRYQPQRRFLVLLATGNGHAIAARGRWSAAGGWAGRWKDHIDRSFIARFADHA